MAVEQFERSLDAKFKKHLQYFQIKQLCEIYPWCEGTIRNYCKEGRFGSILRTSKTGRGMIIPREGVIEFNRKYGHK